MSTPPSPRTSRPALASLVLGLLVFPFLVLAGVPALLCGLRGLREVNAGDGRVRGRGLAFAGMILGAVGCAVTVVGIGAIVLHNFAEKSRRVQCAFNLGQVGIAVNRYHNTHKDQFPRAAVPNADLPPAKRLSWLAAVLPLLDENTPQNKTWRALADKIDLHRAWDDAANATPLRINVPVFFCPSQTAYNPRTDPGRTSYVGLAGVDPDAALLPKTSPRAGFFGYDRTIARTDVTAGISFTLMATETARDTGPWLAAGVPTLRGLDPDETQYAGRDRPFGGLHPDGLNALYVDAHVETLHNIRAEHFRALATIAHQPAK